jgi:hypothetical protein
MKTLPAVVIAAGLTLLPVKKINSGIDAINIPGLNTGIFELYGKAKFKGITQYEYKGDATKGDSTEVVHAYEITVQEGDNLSVIADRINSLNRMRSEHPFPKEISWVDIYNWNYSHALHGGDHISNPDIITPGQQIRFSTTHQTPTIYKRSGLTVES